MKYKQTPLKKDILDLKLEFELLENKFNEYALEIEKREKRWKNCEKKLEDLIKFNDAICTLNVGGQKFDVSLYHLKSRRNTLFYKQILKNEIQKNKETFYDRDPIYFPLILNFLRTGSLKVEKLKEEEKEDLLNEAQFYEIRDLIDKLRETVGEIELVKFEASSICSFNEALTNSDNIIYLKDKEDLTNGILTGVQGIITFTLSAAVEIEELEIGGFKDNTNNFIASNMKGAEIETSLDNIVFNKVGVLPENINSESLIKVKLQKSKAKYLRIKHQEHAIGIGYLEIKEASNNNNN